MARGHWLAFCKTTLHELRCSTSMLHLGSCTILLASQVTAGSKSITAKWWTWSEAVTQYGTRKVRIIVRVPCLGFQIDHS